MIKFANMAAAACLFQRDDRLVVLPQPVVVGEEAVRVHAQGRVEALRLGVEQVRHLVQLVNSSFYR